MCISLCLKPAMVSVRMGILLAFIVTLQIILSKADPCCKTLMLQSSGSLAEGNQKHLLGLYYQDDSKDGEDGTMVYRQVIVLSSIENQRIWKNAKILHENHFSQGMIGVNQKFSCTTKLATGLTCGSWTTLLALYKATRGLTQMDRNVLSCFNTNGNGKLFFSVFSKKSENI